MHNMDYMFTTGFLGTRAPYFMDIVTLIVALLPLLVYSAIILAKKKKYKLHALAQNIIFLFSVVVIGYFEYGVRISGGFKAFIQDSDLSYTYVIIILGLHIFIATVTLLYWTLTIVKVNYQLSKEMIPGVKSREHKMNAIKTFLGIILTSFSGIWVYLLLFVY